MRGRNNKKSQKVVHLFQKDGCFRHYTLLAVILMVALWFQGANPKKTPNHDQATPYTQSEDPAVPVTKSSEVVKMPAANAEVVVQKKFYEDAELRRNKKKHLSL